LGVNAELAQAPVLMADNLNANISNISVPVLMLLSEQPKRACGKWVIVANKLCSMDMYNRDPSGDAKEEKVKPMSRSRALANTNHLSVKPRRRLKVAHVR
jgi:hypothetical protein